MFTTTPLPRFGHADWTLRGSAGGCEPCQRGSAGAMSRPSLGAAFLIGAIVIIAVAVL